MILSVIIGPLGNEKPVATEERAELTEQSVVTEAEVIENGETNRGVVRDIPSEYNDRTTNHRNSHDTLVSDHGWLTFEATAYVAMCSSGCTGITRTGIDVRNTITYEGKRIIAADPNVLPLGSEVVIELADGRTIEATVQDTGGAIDGYEIDLLVADEATAWEFGRQDVELRIINENN
jgi:3D (Asp-Asp-Asp) domain-containing protein